MLLLYYSFKRSNDIKKSDFEKYLRQQQILSALTNIIDPMDEIRKENLNFIIWIDKIC